MKKLVNLHIIVLCIIALLNNSCENDLPEDNTGKTNIPACEVRFSLSRSLRSTDTDFQSGDRIGVFAVERQEGQTKELAETGNYADNKCYRFNGSDFEAEQEADKIFFPNGKVLDFYTYYPYRDIVDNTFNIRHEVFTDQSDTNNYMNSDLLFAKNISGISNQVVQLNFEHMMALVEINIRAGGGKEIRGVKMLNPIYISDLNLNIGDITSMFDLHRQDIQMRRWNESNSQIAIYRALVPRQSIKKDEPVFVIELDDGIRNYKALEDVNLLTGAKNAFDFALQYKIETSVVGSGTVSQGGIYDCGHNLQLIATPEAGMRFEGWFEGGLPVWDYEYYNFSVERDRKLEARFTDDEYKVVVQATEGGKAYTPNGHLYKFGQECLFVAEADPFYTFMGWYINDRKTFDYPVFSMQITSDMLLEARFRYLYPSSGKVKTH